MRYIVILQVSFICSGTVKAIALAASQSCGEQNTAHHQQFMPKRKALFICFLQIKSAKKRFSSFAKATEDKGKKGWSSAVAQGYGGTS